MPYQLDHLIIGVHDLTQAMQDYQTLGFHTVYGGRHASGATHNALVVFGDGSYFELLAATGEEAQTGFPDYRTVLGTQEGLLGYCLRCDDLQQEALAMQGRKAAIADPQVGGRKRPDGQELRWYTATLIDGSMMPFFIQDDSPREWRVPAIESPHPNGASAIIGLHLLAYDLPQELRKLQALLGTMPLATDAGHEFDMEGFTLTVSAANTPQERAYLGERSTLPYHVTLEGLTHPIDATLTHGVGLSSSLGGT